MSPVSGQEVPASDLPDNAALSGQPVPPEDMPPQSGQEVPPDDLPDNVINEKYQTKSQQGLTGLEGVARGATAGLSDALAVGMRKGASALGVSPENLHYVAPAPEDISGRKKANPIESTSSEILGNVGLLGNLSQMGTKAIDGMIKMGIIAGGDEISKAMLGQGDPLPAVASHIAESGALGLVTGGLFGKLENVTQQGLQALENSKLGSKLSSFVTGLGHAASFPGVDTVSLEGSALLPEEAEGLDNKAFKSGQKAYNQYMVSLPKYSARVAAPYLGGRLGGVPGAAASGVVEQLMEHVAPKVSQKVVAPALMKVAASGNLENLSQIIDHATTIGKGASKINKGVQALFGSAGDKVFDFATSEKNRDKLKQWIEGGGVDADIQNTVGSQSSAQGYAEGGQVNLPQQGATIGNKPDPVATHWPDQAMALTETAGNVSHYLKSIKPNPQTPALPYDTVHKNPKAENSYNEAIDLANEPLSVLRHLKKGTIQPRHIDAIKSMYPGLHGELSKKITQEITKQQLDGKNKIPYKVRQGLSLFMGTPLDSTLTQQGIAAAQATFMQAQPQPQPKNSKSELSNLGKSTMTASQSREARLNKN